MNNSKKSEFLRLTQFSSSELFRKNLPKSLTDLL